MSRDDRLELLMEQGCSWEEALQVADGEPLVVTVGGETFDWYPLAQSQGFPSASDRIAR